MNSISIHTPKEIRLIGPGEPSFVIAEMSANHNQDFDKAVEIIKLAAEAGADAIKLQTYTPDTMTIDSNKEWFIVGDIIGSDDNPESWKGASLYELYKRAYTPMEWFPKLKKVAEGLGLVFFSTPYEETAVDFLENLSVPLYKVASYEVTHIPLLKRIAQTGKPVIVSVGFSGLDDIELALKTLRDNGAGDIALLHCTTAYSGNPSLEHANLATMIDMQSRFGVVVGFSDNNAGIEIPLQASLMGASIIEKHIVAFEGDNVIDGDFSSGPEDFKKMIDGIRRSEKITGHIKYGIKSKTEEKNSKFMRSVFVVDDIKSGDTFTRQNIRVIRPNLGLHPKYYEDVLGKLAIENIEKGTPLDWDMIKK